jgi:hypothetical protein
VAFPRLNREVWTPCLETSFGCFVRKLAVAPDSSFSFSELRRSRRLARECQNRSFVPKWSVVYSMLVS